MLDLPIKSVEQSPNLPDLEENQDLMDEEGSEKTIVLATIQY